MSRTAIFRLIKTGELQSIKHDGYRLIPANALLEFAGPLRYTEHRAGDGAGNQPSGPITRGENHGATCAAA